MQFMKNLNVFASRDDQDDVQIGTTLVGESVNEEMSDDGEDNDEEEPDDVSHPPTEHVETCSTGNSDSD